MTGATWAKTEPAPAERPTPLADLGPPVGRVLGIRPEDYRNTAAGFVTLLLAMAGHSVLETARDGLFLASLPPTLLPWVYLAIAGLTLAGSTWQRRFLSSVSKRRTLSLTLLVGAVITASFGLLSPLHHSTAGLLVFYVWTGLLATTVVVQFWLLAGEVMDFGQAKRAFAVLGGGGLLGALLGSLLANAALLVVHASMLPLVAAALLGAAAFVPPWFKRRRLSPDVRPSVPPGAAPGRLRLDPYMRRILALVLLGTMTVTVADYIFKSVVAREVAPQELASFFARYYAALNGLSLVVQFVVTPRLLRSAGVHRVLQVTPLCLLAASIGFATTGGLFAVLLLRGADGALRHSVNRVGNEMLYLPLRTEVRRRFRAFVEAVGLRAGQALASLLILFALVLDLGPVALSLAAVALAAAWLATTGRLRDLYVGRFQRDLGKQPFETPSFINDLDTRGLSALYRALGSDDDAEVVAALEMLAACDERELLPKDLLTHRSPRIVLWALEHLPGPRADVRRATEQLLTHSDASVRAAALRHRIVSGAEAELLERFREDPSAAVRATALVGSIRSGALDANAARRELRTVVSAPEREGRSALGRTLFLLPPEHRVRLATELLEREERGLAVLVVKSIAVEPDPRFVPVLIPLLARQSARGEARRALVAIGPAALEAASAALSDAATPPELRRHLPRTISHFSGPAAVAILEAALAQERDDAVAFKILRGLGSLRRDAPDLPVNRALLEGAARTMIRRALVGACFGYGLGAARRRLSHVNTTSAELLAATLADDAERAFERLFRLMHVLEPTRSMELIFTAVRSGDPDIRARGRELFEHLAPQELRREVTPLLDDAPLSERLSEVVLARVAPQCALALALGRLCDGEPRRGPGSEPPILAAFARALAALCRHESPVLSAVACHYRAELGLGSATEPELESLRKLGTRPLPEGVDQALAARTSRSRERPHAR